MIHPFQHSSRHPGRYHARRSAGFTLMELMVVVGIIALLMAIALPMLLKAYSASGRIKTAADLSVIGMALEEYKKDHGGQYPQVTQPNTGFAVLARELVGVYGDGVLPTPPNPANTPDPDDPPAFVVGKDYLPGDSVNSGFVALVAHKGVSTANTNEWAPFNPHDGLDGIGGRTGGKKTIGYLPPERLRVRGCAILDANDKPILYFPARPGNLNISVGSAYVALAGYASPPAVVTKYNAEDNIEFFTRSDDPSFPDALRRIRVMLGDTNADGKIDTGETAAASGPYILWAAGPNGLYGPKTLPSNATPTSAQVSKCDDVMNFK